MNDDAAEAMVAHAHDVLADQRTFTVPAEKWDEFMALLDAPSEPNPGIARLFAERSGFVPR